MRVLYLSDQLGIHDDRFVAALVEAGHRVVTATAGPLELWHRGEARVTLPELLAEGFDVAQVGPLESASSFLPVLGHLPVVATCWGSEAFRAEPGPISILLAEAATVLCDCRAVAERLIELGARSDRLVRFPWGIDLDRFGPSAGADRAEERLLVTSRAWEPFYQHDLVLRALRRAVDAGHTDLRLLMFGRGSAEADLRGLASDLELADRVELRAPTGELDLGRVLGRATAWVNAAPSDGTCISLLQAMASGTAVVTTDVPCAHEAVGPVDVAFFPIGDEAALAGALAGARRPDAEAQATTRAWLAAFADWSANRGVYVRAVQAAAS